MDYFEEIVSKLLEEQGYWIRRSLKINLSKKEKSKIGKPSMPRPEIDLVALNFQDNQVIAFEAKSFLDSLGVDYRHLIEDNKIPKGRYKLFTCKKYRDIFLRKLKDQLVKSGMANAKTKVTLGLIAGKIQRKEDDNIKNLFQKKGWVFWSPLEVNKKVARLAEMGYENHPAVITAKILLR